MGSLGQRSFSCLKQWTFRVQNKIFSKKCCLAVKLENLVFNCNLLFIDCERYCSLVKIYDRNAEIKVLYVLLKLHLA